MKLKDSQALTSFEYSWLLKRIFPYIKPFMGRVILGFIIAIPVGLLDGVVSFALFFSEGALSISAVVGE